MKKNTTYDRNFRVNAVKLALEKNLFKVAKELGVPSTNIYRWRDELQKYGTESFCGGGHFRNPEQKRLSELKRALKKKLKESELHIEIFKCATKYISEGKPMIFHFIENNLDKYPLWKMCKVLGIRTETYHRWKNNVLSPRQAQTIILQKQITSIFYEYKMIYGSGKISAELQSRGFKLKPAQVTFYMKKLGLRSKLNRKDNSKSNSTYIPYNPYVFPNILNRNFKVEESSQVWVTGITSVHTMNGLLFLTIIMDLFERKIIGWSMSDGLTIKETSMPAWEMAVLNQKINKELMFHSDRGIQYANKLFTNKLNSYKFIRRSMSRQGNRLDNAVPRSFFTSLKAELVDLDMLLTQKKMKEKIIEYIDCRH